MIWRVLSKMSDKIKWVAMKIICIAFAATLVVAAIGLGVWFGMKKTNDTPADETTNGEEKTDWSKLRYAALGDSITFGLNNGTQIDKPYCESVKENLGLKWAKNYGINGSTIATANALGDAYMPMCQRYAQMEDADIVSVMGGTNDYGRYVTMGDINSIDATTFCGALNLLCSGLKDKYPNAFVFFMTPLKLREYNGRSEGAEFDQLRSAIKQICGRWNIPVLDTATLADFSQEYNATEYNGDGLHPSQDFHTTVLAPVITQFIRDNYTANNK